MDMLLHAINQAALVKSTDNSGNSCNMRASETHAICGFTASAEINKIGLLGNNFKLDHLLRVSLQSTPQSGPAVQ
jgi:hypothetical protein